MSCSVPSSDSNETSRDARSWLENDSSSSPETQFIHINHRQVEILERLVSLETNQKWLVKAVLGLYAFQSFILGVLGLGNGNSLVGAGSLIVAALIAIRVVIL